MSRAKVAARSYRRVNERERIARRHCRTSIHLPSSSALSLAEPIASVRAISTLRSLLPPFNHNDLRGRCAGANRLEGRGNSAFLVEHRHDYGEFQVKTSGLAFAASASIDDASRMCTLRPRTSRRPSGRAESPRDKCCALGEARRECAGVVILMHRDDRLHDDWTVVDASVTKNTVHPENRTP